MRRARASGPAGRRTNLALLLLLAAALSTGFLGWAIGTSWSRAVIVAHGISGLAVVVLVPWKSPVARRGLARGRLGRSLSVLLAALVGLAVVTGLLHASGLLVSLGPVTSMQVHVGAALGAVPVAAWHVVARPVRPRRTDLGRRNLLRAGALLGGTGLAYAAAEGLVWATDLPGAGRRFTGSHEAGSFRPKAMPVTQWLDDPVPAIDGAEWRLRVTGEGTARDWSLDDLSAHTDRVRATLDCTGGWFAEQDWEGIRLDRLLRDPGQARSVLVRSATGYTRRFPVRDLPRLLLAVRVGGRPLSAGHGFPARLVAPGRRGYWWVKWVTGLELSAAPWWWQAPFPVT